MSFKTSLTRTQISAIVSIMLFGMTILINAVGPAAAQGAAMIDASMLPPTVSTPA